MAKRILVVDDEPGVTDFFAAALRPLDCEIVCAKSGEEGLEILARQYRNPGFYLVLTDLSMHPGMNGIELVRQIREYESFMGIQTQNRVKTVIMTGYGNKKEREAHEAGCDGFLLKPIGPKQIEALVA